MILALVLMGSILAGALAAFLKANPPIKVFFRRDFKELESWPWWYGMLPITKASEMTGVLVPFHIPIGRIWMAWTWIQFNMTGHYPKIILARMEKQDEEMRRLHARMIEMTVDSYAAGEKAGRAQRRGVLN